MAEASKRIKQTSWRGLLGNHRYLYKKSMQAHAMESARARKKHQHQAVVSNRKMKRKSALCEPAETLKRIKISDPNVESLSILNLESVKHGPCRTSPDNQSLFLAPRDIWEVDSGFCSEASSLSSGRSSPCFSSCPTSVVALDCEMVGTGPGGKQNEVARCSILDYHGNVLYDKYIQPCQPVTNLRTRWSGIRRRHLRNATPFAQAREEISALLEGKVIVGHSIYNDFEVLELVHPCHMVRDTSTTHLLKRLVGFPHKRCTSLKTLSRKLLNREIQVGLNGHCSVEDAKAALDLYKLVEGEWERELPRNDDMPPEPSFASSNHYMQDEYWPEDVLID